MEENFVMMEVVIAAAGCLMAPAVAFSRASGCFLHQKKKIMNKVTHPTILAPLYQLLLEAKY